MRKRVKFLFWVALASFIVSTSLFTWCELAMNPAVTGLFDAVWWWVVTSATVGYGDVVPLTWQGRVVGIFTVLTGFFIYANFVAIIAESVHSFLERRHRGRAQVKAEDHIVLCEYTAIADELIQAIPDCPEFAGKEVVIVSDLVSTNPYPEHHFVNGVPINPAALRLADISRASYVFVFANLRFADPDVKTMHIASRVIALNPRARIFVEMIDPENPLLEYAPDGLVVLNSHDLIASVLRDRKVNPSDWLKMPRESGHGTG